MSTNSSLKPDYVDYLGANTLTNAQSKGVHHDIRFFAKDSPTMLKAQAYKGADLRRAGVIYVPNEDGELDAYGIADVDRLFSDAYVGMSLRLFPVTIQG